MPKITGRSRSEVAAGGRAVRRDRRSFPAQAPARAFPPDHGALHPQVPDHRRFARRHHDGRLPGARPQGGRDAPRSPARPGRLARARRGARLRPDQGRPEGAGRSRPAGRGSARRRVPARQLSQRAAGRGAVGGQDAAGSGPRQGLAGHHGEAVRDRPRKRGGAQRRTAQGLRRGPDLPHRPFPRQGAGAEHSGLPLRQRPVRADLEPQLHRSRRRSTCPRRWISATASASTSRPAPFATWSSPTSSRSSASWRWSRRPRSRRTRSARRRTRCSAR